MAGAAAYGQLTRKTTGGSASTSARGRSAKSPYDGDDVRWYFSKAPLKKDTPASSMPQNEVVGKAEFLRFSKHDSLALEAAYLEREEELLSAWWKEYAYCSEGPAGASASDDYEVGRGETSLREEGIGVVVKGGLYEVDLLQRRCYPVYWHGEDRRVMRGSWFARKGGLDWLPLREDVAEQLEIAYRGQVWHRRGFQPSGLYAARVNLTGSVTGLHALFEGEDATWQAWLTADSAGLQYFLGFASGPSPGIPLRRGFASSNTAQPSQEELRQQREEQLDDYASQVPVKHLVFMVHGIGQRLERANLIDDVSMFQHACAQMAEQHLTPSQRNAQRVLFVPCQWRRGLVLAGESLVDDITMEGLRGIRETVNRTVLDVLYYMSPAYCQDIIDSVTASLNRLYHKFLKRNPGYDGKVSLFGHSLGSVLSYDILCHQEAPIFTPRTPLPTTPSAESSLEDNRHNAEPSRGSDSDETAEIAPQQPRKEKQETESGHERNNEIRLIGCAGEAQGGSVHHASEDEAGILQGDRDEASDYAQRQHLEVKVVGAEATSFEIGDGDGTTELQTEVSNGEPQGNVQKSGTVPHVLRGEDISRPRGIEFDTHAMQTAPSSDKIEGTVEEVGPSDKLSRTEAAAVEVNGSGSSTLQTPQTGSEEAEQYDQRVCVGADDFGRGKYSFSQETGSSADILQTEVEGEKAQGSIQVAGLASKTQGSRKQRLEVDSMEAEGVVNLPVILDGSSKPSIDDGEVEEGSKSSMSDADRKESENKVVANGVAVGEGISAGVAVGEESRGVFHAITGHVPTDDDRGALGPMPGLTSDKRDSCTASSRVDTEGTRAEGGCKIASDGAPQLARLSSRWPRKSGRRQHMPRIAYSKLDFEVDTFFAVGSPLGLFLALRNVRLGIGGGGQNRDDGTTEEMPACRILMNIFHPFDPVAYRLEPLVSKEFVKGKPVHIPFHKGGKRLHIGIQEMTQDLSARLRSLPRHAWESIYAIPTKVIKAFNTASDKGNEKQQEDNVVEVDDYISQVMERLSGSKDGRLDYMLQDDTFQHQYLAALSSHTAYWGDADTALFVLKHLYKDLPETLAAPSSSQSASYPGSRA